MNAPLGSRTADIDDGDKLITLRALQELGLDVHRGTIARWCKAGSFPQPVRLSKRKQALAAARHSSMAR